MAAPTLCGLRETFHFSDSHLLSPNDLLDGSKARIIPDRIEGIDDNYRAPIGLIVDTIAFEKKGLGNNKDLRICAAQVTDKSTCQIVFERTAP
jgi:hypothetical protein